MAGQTKTCFDILALKNGHLFENFFHGKSRGKEVYHIRHANPHPPNAGTATALLWINRDSIEKFGHELYLRA